MQPLTPGSNRCYPLFGSSNFLVNYISLVLTLQPVWLHSLYRQWCCWHSHCWRNLPCRDVTDWGTVVYGPPTHTPYPYPDWGTVVIKSGRESPCYVNVAQLGNWQLWHCVVHISGSAKLIFGLEFNCVLIMLTLETWLFRNTEQEQRKYGVLSRPANIYLCIHAFTNAINITYRLWGAEETNRISLILRWGEYKTPIFQHLFVCLQIIF